MSGLEFVGVGDLHLDGKLRKYLPDLNTRIVSEVEKVFDYARKHGVKIVVFYGDICDVPSMSSEATRCLLSLMTNNSDLRQFYITGNHDAENVEVHSMQLFMDLCEKGLLPHVKVLDKPTTLFRKTDTPLRLLPWPSLDTHKDCLNVIHESVAGAVWDGGRPVDVGVQIKHWTVAGHLHTHQIVGKVHFSGTLYQTSFGEKPKKYFHHVTWAGSDEKPEIRSIRAFPSFKLVNLVVSSEDDLSKIENNPDILYKVFVQADVILGADTFNGKPNVVKVNSFKTKAELEHLIQEELMLDDEFDAEGLLSVEGNLKTWLTSAKVETDLKKAAYRKFKTLVA